MEGYFDPLLHEGREIRVYGGLRAMTMKARVRSPCGLSQFRLMIWKIFESNKIHLHISEKRS